MFSMPGSKAAERSVVYPFITQTISDATSHLHRAEGLLRTEHVEGAIERCIRARREIESARDEIEASSDIITRAKRKRFDDDLDRAFRRLWAITVQVNQASKGSKSLFDKARQLRVDLIAYSYQPEPERAVGG